MPLQVRARSPYDAAPVGPDRPLPTPLAASLPVFVQALSEVLALQRDPWQLRPRMTKPAFGCLMDRVGTFRSQRRPRVASLHLCLLLPAATEACAVVRCGPRSRALALRVECAGSRWLCCSLRAG